MEQREIPDFATDVYLIERLRKFELDAIEADRAARAALWTGFRNAMGIMLLLGGVVYGIVRMFD